MFIFILPAKFSNFEEAFIIKDYNASKSELIVLKIKACKIFNFAAQKISDFSTTCKHEQKRKIKNVFINQ